jgi:hypothetical protein
MGRDERAIDVEQDCDDAVGSHRTNSGTQQLIMRAYQCCILLSASFRKIVFSAAN